MRTINRVIRYTVYLNGTQGTLLFIRKFRISVMVEVLYEITYNVIHVYISYKFSKYLVKISKWSH